MEEQIKITVEKHPDGFVAHARCLGGVVLGQGDTREEALADVHVAIEFHKREFGKKAAFASEQAAPKDPIRPRAKHGLVMPRFPRDAPRGRVSRQNRA